MLKLKNACGFWIFKRAFEFLTSSISSLPGRTMVASICHLQFKNHDVKEKGIRHELTVPHSPQQNGVSERMNRTLVESASSMIADPCVFIRKKDTLTIIAIHVGDLTILAENILKMQRLKDSIKLKFKMHYYVCIVHNKESKQVYLHQGQYTEKMRKKFGQTELKSVPTPADLNVKLPREDGVSRPVDKIW